jgi:hypothetical protein
VRALLVQALTRTEFRVRSITSTKTGANGYVVLVGFDVASHVGVYVPECRALTCVPWLASARRNALVSDHSADFAAE